MINSQQELIAYEEDSWEEFLTRLDLLHVFKPILGLSTDKTVIRGIVRYIVWAYSKSSDKVIMDMEWERNKNNIFEETDLHHNWRDMLVDLKSEALVLSIERWIEYQDEDVATQIITLKDLKREMQISSVSALKKANGSEIDYDQKFKNAGYVIQLREMIKNMEAELTQNDNKLKSGVKEVRASKIKNTAGIEKFAI